MKVSEKCPFCENMVKDKFSLIAPDYLSFFLMHFSKVHPKCIVERTNFGTAPPGAAEAYGGLIGKVNKKFSAVAGKTGSAMLSGDLNYLWPKMSKAEREEAFTGKIIMSFKTPEIFMDQISMGWDPKLLKIIEFFVTLAAFGFGSWFAYLYYTNVIPTLTRFAPFFSVFCFILSIFAFFITRNLAAFEKFFQESKK